MYLGVWAHGLNLGAPKQGAGQHWQEAPTPMQDGTGRSRPLQDLAGRWRGMEPWKGQLSAQPSCWVVAASSAQAAPHLLGSTSETCPEASLSSPKLKGKTATFRGLTGPGDSALPALSMRRRVGTGRGPAGSPQRFTPSGPCCLTPSTCLEPAGFEEPLIC